MVFAVLIEVVTGPHGSSFYHPDPCTQDPGVPGGVPKIHQNSNLFPGPSQTIQTGLRAPKTIQNDTQNPPSGHQISESVEKVKPLKNDSFYNGLSTYSHSILASFPSQDHQKHGPGHCLPFWYPKSQKNNKMVPKWIPGGSQNGPQNQ